MTLGERIKALRKERGWTLSDLSLRINLTISYLSDLERDRTEPSLKVLVKIANTFDMTTVNFLLPVDLGETLEALPFEDGLPFA